MKIGLFGFLVLLLAAMACAAPTATPTPAPTATATPAPTPTPAPTATATPAPTPTPTPSPKWTWWEYAGYRSAPPFGPICWSHQAKTGIFLHNLEFSGPDNKPLIEEVRWRLGWDKMGATLFASAAYHELPYTTAGARQKARECNRNYYPPEDNP